MPDLPEPAQPEITARELDARCSYVKHQASGTVVAVQIDMADWYRTLDALQTAERLRAALTPDDVMAALAVEWDRRHPGMEDSFARKVWIDDHEDNVAHYLRLFEDAGLAVRRSVVTGEPT